MGTMDDYGTRAELQRKTLDEVERLMGIRSTEVRFACLQTVWQTVAGLVDREIHEILTAALKETKAAEDARLAVPKSDNRAFIDPAKREVRLLMGAAGADTISVYTATGLHREGIVPATHLGQLLVMMSARFKPL